MHETEQQEVIEEWKEVEGFPLYYVSNLGNIKSLKASKEKILKPFIVNGYEQVKLSRLNKNYETEIYNRFVHRLTAAAWCEKESQEQNEVHHKDHNKRNNTCFNLQWVTTKQHKQIHRREAAAAKDNKEK